MKEACKARRKREGKLQEVKGLAVQSNAPRRVNWDDCVFPKDREADRKLIVMGNGAVDFSKGRN